jgi:nicotinamide-nucleotide amidase
MNAELEPLSREVGQALERRGRTLAAAESCTGGWLCKVVTDTAGSSAWFDRGFVTYTNLAKQEMLGVREATLAAHGAVSEQTVREMAEGALARSRADIAVAISGVAGPGGGSLEKLVGVVWLAWAARGAPTQAARIQLAGDREAVRRQAVARALQGVLDVLARAR